MQHYLLSIFAGVGGVALVIVACQTIVFMEQAIEEMHYRETCARHLSDSKSSDALILKKLGLKENVSISKFCNHYD